MTITANAVAVLLDERALRDTIREEVERATHTIRRTDRRTADSARGELPGEPKEWLTNAEAQEYLSLSRMTLQRYRDEGRLPYSKVGSNVFYKRADILALLESGRREVRR